MNKVILIGRITKDPELKFTPNGNAVCSFTLAVNRQYKNENGEAEADFINCVAWRGQAQFIGDYVEKGNLLAVSGSLQTRSYQAQDGSTRYVTEVQTDSVQCLTPREKKESLSDNPNNIKYQDDLPF